MRYGFAPELSKDPAAAEVVSTGSLLQWVPETFAGIVLGTGLIADTPRRFPDATILAVRGALTARLIDAPHDVVLADPGLLASTFFKRPPARRHVLGLVPHYVDIDNPVVQALARKHPREIKVIDVRREPEAVFRDIGACESILSSSLHGLITADSFGIPNAWAGLSDKVIGDGFKFRDYFSSLGIRHEPCKLDGSESVTALRSLTRPVPDSVGERRAQIDALFLSLSSHLQKNAGI
jgi:pyruvyltransferase